MGMGFRSFLVANFAGHVVLGLLLIEAGAGRIDGPGKPKHIWDPTSQKRIHGYRWTPERFRLGWATFAGVSSSKPDPALADAMATADTDRDGEPRCQRL
jgi:hypothetical protein